MTAFEGAKLALRHGDYLLTYLRDAFAHIPFPSFWDLPGGGREGDESPEACALRELHEEFGLTLPQSRLTWRRDFVWRHMPDRRAWFFGGEISAEEISAIRFGDEGQFWRMMPLAEFIAHERAVPDLQARVSVWLAEDGSGQGLRDSSPAG